MRDRVLIEAADRLVLGQLTHRAEDKIAGAICAAVVDARLQPGFELEERPACQRFAGRRIQIGDRDLFGQSEQQPSGLAERE